MNASREHSTHAPISWRIWVKRVGLFILTLLCVGLGAWIWVNSQFGRDYIEQRIERTDFAGQQIEIDGLTGAVLGRFRIEQVTISDAQGQWLTAQDIEVDWTPRALLSRRAQIEALKVGLLNVDRRPVVTMDSEGDPPIDGFNIDRLDFPQITLSEPVLGRSLNVTLQGGLAHSQDGGRASLDLVSGQGDRADVNLSWSPDFVLRGDADIDGPAGGLMASLLRLNAAQSVEATVSTRNNMTDIEAAIDGNSLLSATLMQAEDHLDIEATLTANAHPSGDQLHAVLGGSTKLEARWPVERVGGFSLTIAAPKVNVTGDGRRENDSIIFDRLDLSAANPIEAFNNGDVRISTLTLSGSSRFERGIYAFDGQLDAKGISRDDLRIDRLSGPFAIDYGNDDVRLDTRLTGRASGRLNSMDRSVFDVGVEIDLDRRIADFDRATVELPGFRYRTTGQMGFGDQTDGRLSGQYRIETDRFFEGPSATLSGRADVNFEGERITLVTRGDATNFANFPEQGLTLLGQGASFQGAASLQDGIVNLGSGSFRNDNFSLSGRSKIAGGNVDGDLIFNVDSYADETVQVDSLRTKASFNGSVDDIALTSNTEIARIQTANLAADAAVLRTDGRFSGGALLTNFEASADMTDGPLTAIGELRFAEGAWSVSDLDADLTGLSADGSISGVGGDVSALRANLQIVGTHAAVPADNMDVRLNLADARVNAEGTIGGINTEALQDVTVYFTAAGPRDAVGFDINAAGRTLVQDFTRTLEFSASGVADLGTRGPGVRTDFAGELGRQALSGSGFVNYSSSGWAGTLTADLLGGSLNVELSRDEAQTGPGQFSFTIDRVKNSELLLLLGRPVTEGTLRGQGRFGLFPDRVEGQARFNVDDLRTPGSDQEPIGFQIDVGLADERLTVNAAASDEALAGRVFVDGMVDTMPRFPLLVWPPEIPFEGRADLRGNIGPVAELFLPPLTNVSGELDTDLTFSVPAQPDDLSGSIRLTNGEIEQGTIGLHLVDLAVQADLNGERITVSTLSAKGKTGGTLQGSGRMGVRDGLGSVDIATSGLRVFSRREGYARVSGDLRFTRDADLLRLAGDLNVTDAEFNVARLPKPGLPTLEVRFPDGQPDDEENATRTRSVTEINVTLRSSGPINVTGRGLDALMSLDAQVTGSFQNPVISGRAEIDRGRFSVLGKRFTFRESEVTILDEIMQSRLNMEAVREADDFTAIVALRGTIERPELELSAEPTLPEDEVLSRILFGRSPTQLSALETARLAAALAQLSGGSGFDLLGSLENAVGLDTLDVGQSASGQTQLTTGKYLSEDVYLEVRSTAESTPGVAVEWQARRNISLEAETVPGESQSVSVQWRKDFD